MGFLERLRAYLERVERAPQGLPAAWIDLAWHQRHFIAECDRAAAHKNPSAETKLKNNLRIFIEHVSDEILEELAPDASPRELADLIDAAISFALGLERTTGSRGRDEEIARFAGFALDRLSMDGAFDGWQWPSRYAFEIRATRRRGDRHVLTRSGTTFLGLPGIEAVRWLLALEAAQALGPMDDWRVSPELAAQLLKEPRGEFDRQGRVWHFSMASIRRLGEMQLLRYEGLCPEGGVFQGSYQLLDRALPLLEEIAEQRPTPFSVLASALLRDEVGQTLDGVRPDPERALRDSAAEATALQARMVVHEIRNALIPAQTALGRLVRDLGDSVQVEPLGRLQRRVDAGIDRALTFADEMLRVANLGVEPPAPFDVAAAVRDALAGVAGELNGGLRYTPPEGAALVVGPRPRFVLAITNLLRNAAQAVMGREGIVEVAIEAQEDRVVLRVDDNGPGVAPEQRRAIFDAGVALRPGGSGQGLALVRQVIQDEMSGSVGCGDSPLGGARFEIVIPAGEARGT